MKWGGQGIERTTFAGNSIAALPKSDVGTSIARVVPFHHVLHQGVERAKVVLYYAIIVGSVGVVCGCGRPLEGKACCEELAVKGHPKQKEAAASVHVGDRSGRGGKGGRSV